MHFPTDHLAMRLRFLCLLAVVAGLLAGCAQVMGPRTLSWSQAELNQMLARRFPIDRRLLQVIDVEVSQPALTLLPQSNRVAVDIHLALKDRWSGTPLQGHLALASALRYEPSDQSLRLADVQVTAFTLDAAGARPPVPLEDLGAVVAENLLDGAVIHRLPAEQLQRLARWGYRPDRVEVTPSGLSLTVVPAS